ncbi:MAG TPA: hypothetical protein VMS93_10280 [Candidatus Saccharimonadales bacterium]|nr:hypothetical protein [Candidatus Saccharimonadales bacterium]
MRTSGTWRRLRRGTAAGVLVCTLATLPAPAGVAICAAETCEGTNSPESIYKNADTPEEALGKLKALIASGSLSRVCLRDAYIFRARCEATLNDRAAAEESFCKVLAQDPGWRPDPQMYTDAAKAAFAAALQRCAPQEKPPKHGGFKWWMAAAGGAAVGVIAVLVGGGSKSSSTATALPGFPPVPSQ